MRPVDRYLPFLKSVAVGILTGVFFSVVLLALPGALLLYLVALFGWHWDLSWIPEVQTMMVIGGAVGGGAAAFLFIKDQHIPYVEEVQDFEEESDTDFRH